MIRRPPRSTQSRSSAASDVYKRQLYHLHGHFHLSLVPRPPHPCRYHSHTVVSRHLLVGGIDVGLVEAGLGHAALQVVGNDHLRDTTNEAKGPDAGTDPVREPLSPAGLGV